MRLNREHGASAVEFALVLPVLLLLLFGIMEFGFILFDKAIITNASRVAARNGIVYQDAGTWEAVKADMEGTISASSAQLVSFGSNIPATTITGNCFGGGVLNVTVDYSYTFLVLPGFALGLPDPLPMQAVTSMNCEKL